MPTKGKKAWEGGATAGTKETNGNLLEMRWLNAENQVPLNTVVSVF